jgi:uncharacterized protein YcbK (DUF882 family)
MDRFRTMIVLVATMVMPAVAVCDAPAEERRLSFYHTHTGDSLEVVYRVGDEYRLDALERLNGFLADWRNGQLIQMDPELMDALFEIREALGSHGDFEVISAYRSPETNEILRARSNGVAKKSQHLLGKAIDVRLTDTDTARLRDVALALGLGGVGYYARSDFVHIDTGRVRRW